MGVTPHTPSEFCSLLSLEYMFVKIRGLHSLVALAGGLAIETVFEGGLGGLLVFG